MNVIHSAVTLVESRYADMSHVCVSLTPDMTVHVMDQYNSIPPTVTFHVWDTQNKLVALTLTANEVYRLVMERGTPAA